jgi:hypothetical protein
MPVLVTLPVEERIVEISPIKGPTVFLWVWTVVALAFGALCLFPLFQDSVDNRLLPILMFSVFFGSGIFAFCYLGWFVPIRFRIVLGVDRMVVETTLKNRVLRRLLKVDGIIEFRMVRNGVDSDGELDSFPRYGVVAVKSKNYLLFGGCGRIEVIKILEELVELYGIPGHDHGDHYLDYIREWDDA